MIDPSPACYLSKFRCPIDAAITFPQVLRTERNPVIEWLLPRVDASVNLDTTEWKWPMSEESGAALPRICHPKQDSFGDRCRLICKHFWWQKQSATECLQAVKYTKQSGFPQFFLGSVPDFSVRYFLSRHFRMLNFENMQRSSVIGTGYADISSRRSSNVTSPTIRTAPRIYSRYEMFRT